jgi:hypothetical protein
MLDAEKLCLAKELVGVLYSLTVNTSKRDNGLWDIYDEDAIAFAKAYKDTMVRWLYSFFLSDVRSNIFMIFIQDYQKQGGKNYLPGHLHDKVRKGLRKCLTSAEFSTGAEGNVTCT